MECIICRTEKDANEFSDEHVIPESLGGYYHIHNVCRPCNSHMGGTVDSALVNHKLAELYRFCERLGGKSGTVPNPFSGALASTENPDVKARAFTDEDGVLKFLLLPRVVVNEENGLIKSIEISVDAEEELEIQRILHKKLARLGLDSSHLASSELIHSAQGNNFTARWRIDGRSFKIGLLKIAYEFAVDSVDTFYESDEAREIARILRETDYEAVESFVKIGSGLQPEVFEPFVDYLDAESKKHYLVLVQTGMGLVCCIKLHSLFCCGVVLSPRQGFLNRDLIFGVNDIKQGTFRKMRLDDVVEECMGPIHSRLGYSFLTEAEALRGYAEVNSPDFLYETDIRGCVQLFSADGLADGRRLCEILESAACSRQRHNGWLRLEFEFDTAEELFARSVATGNTYRVSAMEISRKFVSKI